jgi:hypothetical protein
MTIKDKIVPNLVGVDIGCGMETVVIDGGTAESKNFDPARLDEIIHLEIPSGMDSRDDEHEFIDKMEQTAKIVNIIKPIYNFKAAENQEPWKKKKP